MAPEVPHGRRHQGRCASCSQLGKAPGPAERMSGSGPRRPGGSGAMAGLVGARRRAVQALGAAVCGIPLRQGALQQRVERVLAAMGLSDTARGEGARTARVHDMDATSGQRHLAADVTGPSQEA
jgi:hypothetical protein